MKRHLLWAVLLVVTLCACSKQEKVVLLGSDLNDWTCVLKDVAPDAPQSTFVLRDGILQVSGQPFGYLRTNQKYGNYTLHVEWRWAGGERVDGGIYCHIQDGDRVWPKAVQCQLTEQELGLFISGIRLDQMDENPKGPYRKPALWTQSAEKAVGEWNDTDIECRGNHIVVRINGQVANEADCDAAEGYIGIQSEGGAMEVRNVYIVKN